MIIPADMDAAEFLRRFPESEANVNCLEDIACKSCGNRERFRIEATITAIVEDEGTDCYDDAAEWDARSGITCSACKAAGTVAGFTIDGLDYAIAKAKGPTP